MKTTWPPIIQASAMPIMGGWGVRYNQDGISLHARAPKPIGVVSQIVNYRSANRLDPDIEGVKSFCLSEWYKRDPKRFKVHPQELAPAINGASHGKPALLTPFFQAAARNDARAFTAYKKELLNNFQTNISPVVLSGHRASCPDCLRILRDHYANAPNTSKGEWTYQLYTRLMALWELTPKPKPLIFKEYNISS